jgi:hypothetical protein
MLALWSASPTSKELRIVLPVAARTRLWLGVAGVAAVIAAGAFGSSDDSAGAAAARTRSLTDMPDEISGPQVHFLYIVPADGADAQLDTNGRWSSRSPGLSIGS